MWLDQASFAARDHYIVKSRLAAYRKLGSHAQFLLARMLAIKEGGSLPPPDMKQSMDSLVWASKQCPDVDELKVIREELIHRYGAACFKPADEYGPGHCVDPVVQRLLGKACADPAPTLVMQELLDIAAEAPALPLSPDDLKGGWIGADPMHIAPAPAVVEQPLQSQPPQPYSPQANQGLGSYGPPGYSGGASSAPAGSAYPPLPAAFSPAAPAPLAAPTPPPWRQLSAWRRLSAWQRLSWRLSWRRGQRRAQLW